MLSLTKLGLASRPLRECGSVQINRQEQRLTAPQQTDRYRTTVRRRIERSIQIILVTDRATIDLKDHVTGLQGADQGRIDRDRLDRNAMTHTQRTTIIFLQRDH